MCDPRVGHAIGSVHVQHFCDLDVRRVGLILEQRPARRISRFIDVTTTIHYFFVGPRVVLFFRPDWSVGLVCLVLHKDGLLG